MRHNIEQRLYIHEDGAHSRDPSILQVPYIKIFGDVSINNILYLTFFSENKGKKVFFYLPADSKLEI
jgi:hypothetical protein